MKEPPEDKEEHCEKTTEQTVEWKPARKRGNSWFSTIFVRPTITAFHLSFLAVLGLVSMDLYTIMGPLLCQAMNLAHRNYHWVALSTTTFGLALCMERRRKKKLREKLIQQLEEWELTRANGEYFDEILHELESTPPFEDASTEDESDGEDDSTVSEECQHDVELESFVPSVIHFLSK